MSGELTAGRPVSLQQIKAWWTYSELRSPHFGAEYQDDPRVPPLWAKIQMAPFGQLPAVEVNALAEIFDSFRGRLLNHYWADVEEFIIELWSADQLGRVYAMSEVDPLGEGRYRPLTVYAASLRPTGATARLDPRVAADREPLTVPLRSPDPVIVGLYKGLQVLIDGYFRSLVFMRSAGTRDHIVVLTPIVR